MNPICCCRQLLVTQDECHEFTRTRGRTQSCRPKKWASELQVSEGLARHREQIRSRFFRPRPEMTDEDGWGDFPRRVVLARPSKRTKVLGWLLVHPAASSIYCGISTARQGSYRGAPDDVAGRRKPGAVARTVPDLLPVVPTDVAGPVRAHTAQGVKLASRISIERYAQIGEDFPRVVRDVIMRHRSTPLSFRRPSEPCCRTRRISRRPPPRAHSRSACSSIPSSARHRGTEYTARRSSWIRTLGLPWSR